MVIGLYISCNGGRFAKYSYTTWLFKSKKKTSPSKISSSTFGATISWKSIYLPFPCTSLPPSSGFLHSGKPQKTVSKNILGPLNVCQCGVKLIDEQSPMEHSLYGERVERQIFMISVQEKFCTPQNFSVFLQGHDNGQQLLLSCCIISLGIGKFLTLIGHRLIILNNCCT